MVLGVWMRGQVWEGGRQDSSTAGGQEWTVAIRTRRAQTPLYGGRGGVFFCQPLLRKQPEKDAALQRRVSRVVERQLLGTRTGDTVGTAVRLGNQTNSEAAKLGSTAGTVFAIRDQHRQSKTGRLTNV